jgi:hypothetical protein
MHTAAICAQVVIALSIAFVWIVRLLNIVTEFDDTDCLTSSETP